MAPRGLTDLLAREVAALGGGEVRDRGQWVEFAGALECAYRVCLESRVASRVFWPIARIQAPDTDSFYRALRDVDWREVIDPKRTLACEFTGRHPTLTHSHFAALRLKDAICDGLRETTGRRPDVVTDRPDVRVHAHANGANVIVSVDLAGEGLHRRGYRSEAGEAPLRENLAAGLLLRAGWTRESTAAGATFLDPLCGSGTLVIEAASIALDRAPGLTRDWFGFFGWRGHDPATWRRVREAAEARARAHLDAIDRGERPTPALLGRDRDARLLATARRNAARAGVEGFVRFEPGRLDQAAPPEETSGLRLLATNPPYGVRLEDREAARALHRELGRVMRERFRGWRAAVLTGAPDLGLELGLRAHRVHTLWNGALECRLLRFDIEAAAEKDLRPVEVGVRIDPRLARTPGAKMLANRLRKNLRQLEKWGRREGVSCWRLYDADMPEYAFAFDRYVAEDGLIWIVAQEYAAPASIEEDAARRRRAEALATLAEVTGVPPERIELRTRRRSARGEQYRKRDASERFHVVHEDGLRFEVNFRDYLDTGLFLDHRLTRRRLRERSAAGEGRFLNLFCYTATATIHAIAGGARRSLSLDLSRTYLEWARRNLALNGFARPEHRLEQADCREWLAAQSALPPEQRESWDLIFLDPPTFSNSKRMEGVLDVQRDHAAMIDACVALLAPGGLLVFSTNAQRFRIDPAVGERHGVRDIGRETLPLDFARNARIHHCFEIRAR